MNKENGFSATISSASGWATGLQRRLLLITAACLLVACSTTDAAQAKAAQEELVTSASTEVAAEYPEPLRGHWMPKDMACPSPIDYDSDSLIVIDQDRLAHYEDGNKPVRVRQISTKPQAWAIESLLNIAGDGYDTPVTEVFVLGGSDLAIVTKNGVGTFRKCN